MAQPTDPPVTKAGTDAQPPRPNDPRPEAPDRRPSPAAEASSLGWGPILATLAILILAGLLGAAWYFHYWPFASQESAASTDQAGASTSGDAASQSADTMRAVNQNEGTSATRKDLDALSKRLDQLQRQIADRTSPEIEPLQNRVAALEGLPKTVQDLSNRLDELTARLGATEQEIKLFHNDAELQSLRGEATTQQKRVEAEASSASTKPELQAKLDNAIGSFRDEQYQEARRLFDDLRGEFPEDARVWYYSALSTGLTTGQWQTTADRFAREGMDRERLGHPDRKVIDEALKGLNTRTGKDWIDAYRRRARAMADSSR